jgi:hypothetical protein
VGGGGGGRKRGVLPPPPPPPPPPLATGSGVDVRRGSPRVGPGAGLGELLGLGDQRRHLRVDRVQVGGGDGLGLAVAAGPGARAGGSQEAFPELPDRTAALPLLDLRARAVAEVAHALRVGPRAVGLELEERRPAAAPRTLHRFASQLVNRFDDVAIDEFVPGQAVGPTAPRDTRVAGRVGKRHLGGELVVLADEQHRQLPDRGQVQALVEGAVVHGPVPEERHGHPVRLQQLETVARAGRLEDARADNPAGAHQADFGGEQVHAAAAPPRAAGRPAVQLGDQLARGQALGQGVAVPAVRAEDHVVLTQVGAHADGDRLLADVGVAGSVDQSALMGAGQLLLALPDQLHLPVEPQEQFPACLGLDRCHRVTPSRDRALSRACRPRSSPGCHRPSGSAPR